MFTHHLTDETGRPLYPFLDLNSPLVGFWFLVLYAGHWMYVWMSTQIVRGARAITDMPAEDVGVASVGVGGKQRQKKRE